MLLCSLLIVIVVLFRDSLPSRRCGVCATQCQSVWRPVMWRPPKTATVKMIPSGMRIRQQRTTLGPLLGAQASQVDHQALCPLHGSANIACLLYMCRLNYCIQSPPSHPVAFYPCFIKHSITAMITSQRVAVCPKICVSCDVIS